MTIIRKPVAKMTNAERIEYYRRLMKPYAEKRMWELLKLPTEEFESNERQEEYEFCRFVLYGKEDEYFDPEIIEEEDDDGEDEAQCVTYHDLDGEITLPSFQTKGD